MRKGGRRQRLPLPAEQFPSGQRCITVYVPNEPTYIANFWGMFHELTRPYSHGNDEDHSALNVAQQWQLVYDQARERFIDRPDECFQRCSGTFVDFTGTGSEFEVQEGTLQNEDDPPNIVSVRRNIKEDDPSCGSSTRSRLEVIIPLDDCNIDGIQWDTWLVLPAPGGKSGIVTRFIGYDATGSQVAFKQGATTYTSEFESHNQTELIDDGFVHIFELALMIEYCSIFPEDEVMYLLSVTINPA